MPKVARSILLDKYDTRVYRGICMATYSTAQAAKRLGMTRVTLQRYVGKKLIAAPPLKQLGGGQFREWSDRDVERARKQMSKLKPRNGRRKKK